MAVIHIAPTDDWIEHRMVDCPCDPTTYFVNPETGELLDDPVTVHESVSGEHVIELCWNETT